MTQPRPYTLQSLADRWGCSAESIRLMVKDGRLPHFRVGRMIRIAARVVDDIETCETSESDGLATDSPSPGGRTESVDVFVLRHAPERKRKPKLSM